MRNDLRTDRTDAAAAIDAAARHLESGKTYVGRPLRITFAAANTPRDIAHGLGVVPDGYEVFWADAEVHAANPTSWSTTVAYLQANAAYAHAVVRFFVLREDPVDA